MKKQTQVDTLDITNAVTPILRSYRNFILRKEDIEKPNYGPNLVVIDDAYTIKEILEKFSQGINLGLGTEGTYSIDDPDHDDIDHEKIKHLDLAEADELRQEMTQRTQTRKAELDEISRAANEKARKDKEQNEQKSSRKFDDSGRGSEVRNDDDPDGENREQKDRSARKNKSST